MLHRVEETDADLQVSDPCLGIWTGADEQAGDIEQHNARIEKVRLGVQKRGRGSAREGERALG